MFGVSSNRQTNYFETGKIFKLVLTHPAERSASKVSIAVIIVVKAKFSTTGSSNKVSTNKCNIDKQSEIAIWLPNRKYLYLLKYDRYHQSSNSKPGFSPKASSNKVSLGDSNNDQQPEMAAETGSNYIFETTKDTKYFSTANLGFTTTGDCDSNRQPGMKYIRYGRQSCHFRLTSLSQSLGYIFMEFVVVENAGFAVGISRLSVIVPKIYISISGFRGHVAISGCRSMLQSLADTFFKLYMVINRRFARGISMLTRLVSEV